MTKEQILKHMAVLEGILEGLEVSMEDTQEELDKLEDKLVLLMEREESV